jgi:xanthosine utilization system XapX-like protein
LGSQHGVVGILGVVVGEPGIIWMGKLLGKGTFVGVGAEDGAEVLEGFLGADFAFEVVKD